MYSEISLGPLSEADSPDRQADRGHFLQPDMPTNKLKLQAFREIRGADSLLYSKNLADEVMTMIPVIIALLESENFAQKD